MTVTIGGSAILESNFADLSERLHRHAFRVLQSREDAEDVASEAILRAIEKAPAGMDSAHLRAWVWRTARRICIDMIRRRRTVQLDVDVPIPGGVNLLSIAVREAIKSLPDDQRQAITLFYIWGFSIDVSAQAAGVGRSAFKSRLFRARTSLRDLLAAPDVF